MVIKENVNNQKWIDIIEANRDNIVDELINLAKDAPGRSQMDLYLYDDGSMEVFNNVDGNSWLNSDNYIVIWNTRGFEFTSPEELADMDTYRFIDSFKDYTKVDVYKILKNLAAEYEYNSIKDLINDDASLVENTLINADSDAYDEMIDDIMYNLYDYEWAESVIDTKIEELY